MRERTLDFGLGVEVVEYVDLVADLGLREGLVDGVLDGVAY